MIIYCVTNLINKKQYIGQTILSLEQRTRCHLGSMKKKDSYFHNALLKYGKENFRWEILCSCKNLNGLNKKEKKLIQKFNTIVPNGYNFMTGGLNSQHSKITKSQIGQSIKNNIEIMDRLKRGLMFGKKHSNKTKQKMSRAHLGKKNFMYGKTHSKEVRKRISETHIGAPFHGNQYVKINKERGENIVTFN